MAIDKTVSLLMKSKFSEKAFYDCKKFLFGDTRLLSKGVINEIPRKLSRKLLCPMNRPLNAQALKNN